MATIFDCFRQFHQMPVHSFTISGSLALAPWPLNLAPFPKCTQALTIRRLLTVTVNEEQAPVRGSGLHSF